MRGLTAASVKCLCATIYIMGSNTAHVPNIKLFSSSITYFSSGGLHVLKDQLLARDSVVRFVVQPVHTPVAKSAWH